MNVNRRGLVRGLPLVLPTDLYSGDVPEVIAGIFARSIDEQVFLFIHQVLAVKLAHFKIGCQLNRIRGAGLLTIPAENAPRKIDAEELRVPAALLIFRGLEGNTAHRAGDGAQITRDAALAAVRVA